MTVHALAQRTEHAEGNPAARPFDRDPRQLDAAGLQQLLQDSVHQAPVAEAAPEPRKAASGGWRPVARRSLKTMVALAVAAAVGWQPVSGLLQTSSVEAVVNARLVSLRAPIDGELVASAGMPSVGSDINGALTLIKVVNERADRARIDDLRRQVGQVEDDREALRARLAAAEQSVATLKARTDQFLAGRIAQLEARQGELKSQIAMAEARQKEAASALERNRRLATAGAMSAASVEQAERDEAVNAAAISEASYRLTQVEVELASARNGTFLGDSYNDRPSSAQRLDEMEQRASDLKAELAARDAQAERLGRELAYEAARHGEVASASIAVPVKGRVWEVLAAPGESVSKGQDIMRLLDCSGALVTASVNETVYNRLHVGMPATFQLRHDATKLDGSIVNLTGIAGAPSNFAIQPSALSKEPYRVTVAVPALARQAGCSVGRTGRVVFNEPESGGIAGRIKDLFRIAGL